jgi:acyl-CoA reductase-like NAD-dependent aldehyde dehydrogenase
MSGQTWFLALTGQVLIALIFIWSGVAKALTFESTTALIAHAHLPMPEVAWLIILEGGCGRTGGSFEGQIYQPTILTDVPPEATISNEETFGPIVLVEAFETVEEAVQPANRTMYGLASSIVARDTYKAFELAPRILTGIVNINSPTVNDEIHAPMGGVRTSLEGNIRRTRDRL